MATNRKEFIDFDSLNTNNNMIRLNMQEDFTSGNRYTPGGYDDDTKALADLSPPADEEVADDSGDEEDDNENVGGFVNTKAGGADNKAANGRNDEEDEEHEDEDDEDDEEDDDDESLDGLNIDKGKFK